MAPNTVGPPSVRTCAWPRSRSQATASAEIEVLAERDDRRRRRQLRTEHGLPPQRGQDERALLEHRMADVDRAAPGKDRNLGLGRKREPPAELQECVPRRRMRPAGSPEPLRRAVQRARADDDDLRERAQQPHHEPVRLAPGRDDLVRLRHRRDRDHAVDRRDEVRIQPRSRKPERAAVQPGELVGQVQGREPLVFEEQIERVEHYALWVPLRARSTNSRRRSAFSSYVPRQNVVTVRECSSRTPRICVHRCSASR